MKLGLPISLMLHAGVFFGVGLFARSAPPLEEGRVIPIEIITIAETTNIRASVKRPENRPVVVPPEDEPMVLTSPMEAAPEEADAIKIAPKEKAPVKTADAAVPDKDPEEALDVPDKPTPPEEEKPSFDLDRLSALIDRSKETAPEKNRQKTLQGEEDRYQYDDVARAGTGEGTKMTLSELDALQSAMYKCWRMPADARNPEKLLVRLNVKMLKGGYVEDVRVIDRAASRANDPGNPFWDVAEQRALRAVSQCAPYDFLPDEKFAYWRNMTLNFRPQL